MEQIRGKQRKRRQQPLAARGQRLAGAAPHREDERSEARHERHGANEHAVRLRPGNEEHCAPQELQRDEQLDPAPALLR